MDESKEGNSEGKKVSIRQDGDGYGRKTTTKDECTDSTAASETTTSTIATVTAAATTAISNAASKKRNTPRSKRVVSFRDHVDDDDGTNIKKNKMPVTPPQSPPLSPVADINRVGNGGYVRVYNLNDSPSSTSASSTTASSTSSSRKRNRSCLSPSPSSSSVSIARVKLPVFQSGWRKLRYGLATNTSKSGSTFSSITGRSGGGATLAEMKARVQSARSLESLLVPQQHKGDVKRLKDEKRKPTVKSDVWVDGNGCSWRLLLFPLGNTNSTFVGIFLEKHTSHLKRNVHVEFHLRRCDNLNSNDDSNIIFPGDIEALVEDNDEESAYVCEFQHRYSSKSKKGIEDWGLNEAHPLCDVLRRCVDDEGFLHIDVYIDDISPPSPLPAARLRPNGAAYGRKRNGDGFGRNVSPTLQRLGFEKKALYKESVREVDGHEIPFAEDTGNDGISYNDTPFNDDNGVVSHELNYDQSTGELKSKHEHMAGLENQGATCYMNSLLQVWFYLPALRRLVLNLPLPAEEGMSDNRDGDDDASTYSYDSMSDSFSSSSSLCSTDADDTNGLSKIDDNVKDVTKCNGDEASNHQNNPKEPTAVEIRVGHGLQCVFARLLYASYLSSNGHGDSNGGYVSTSNPVVSTSELTKAFGWDNNNDVFRQHDVQELSRVLLDKLESVFRNLRLAGAALATPDLFEGKVESYIRCTKVPYSSTKVEPFLDIQLNVKGCPTLYDSLQQFVHEEELEGENQYDASEAGFGKQDAKKGVRIHTLPPVLNIHLKRFEFDMGATMGMIKVHDRLEFPLVMDMTDFLVEGEDDHDYGSRKNVYHLHSIVMHSGCVGGGHYTAYIRPNLDSYDFPRDKLNTATKTCKEKENITHTVSDNTSEKLLPREWFKFDDELVSPVDETAMLEAAYGTPQPTQDSYSTITTENNECNGAANMSMIGRRSRLSLSSNKIHNPRINRDNYHNVNNGHSGMKRQSTASAYMLAYIRESDLPWLLSNDQNPDVAGDVGKNQNDAISKIEDKSTNCSFTEKVGLDEISPELKRKLGMHTCETHNDSKYPHSNQFISESKKNNSVPQCVTIPFITDKEVAAFDSLEGAYIPQFIHSKKQKSGYVRILNDFAMWDGHIYSTYSSFKKDDKRFTSNDSHCVSSTPHEESVQHIRLSIEDSGFGLLRAMAQRTGVPIHRMRLWGTTRRDNGTIRIDACVTKKDLLEASVKQIIVKYLGWTYHESTRSHSDQVSVGKYSKKEKSDMQHWDRPDGNHGFYLEVLPLEWTKSGSAPIECKLVKTPTFHLSCDEFTKDVDYSSGQYLKSDEGDQATYTSTRKESPDSTNSPERDLESIRLGIYLSDDEISVVYDDIVPDVHQDSMLVFFKELSPVVAETRMKNSTAEKVSVGSNEENIDCQNNAVKFLGSALLLDPNVPISVLNACVKLLQNNALDTGANCSLKSTDSLSEEYSSESCGDVLCELITPRKIEHHSITLKNSDGSFESASVESAEITTGDIFVALESPNTKSMMEPHEKSTKQIEIVTRYFRYLVQHIWMHFLPLTAHDAGFLARSLLRKKDQKTDCETDKNVASQKPKHLNRVKPIHGLSVALHPETSMITLLKLFHQNFVEADFIHHFSQIRFTKTNCSVSSMPSFCINPSSSFLGVGSKFKPFIIPPLPLDYPVDFSDPRILGAMKTSSQTYEKALLAQCTDAVISNNTCDDEGLNVKWLVANANDTAALSGMQKRVKHHYVYFDFLPGYDWTKIVPEIAGRENDTYPLPALFVGRDAAPRSPFCSSSIHLPLVNFIFPPKVGARARDLLMHFLNESRKFIASSKSGCSMDGDEGYQKRSVCKSFLPVLLLVKKNRVDRLICYEESVHSAYPFEAPLELPRGRVRSESARAGGVSTQRKKGNSRGRSTRALSLQWNAEARQGCVEIGSTTLGSLVLEMMPLDAFFDDQKTTTTNKPTADSISYVQDKVLQEKGCTFSTFPSTVPVQVIFYLDGYDRELHLRYVPLLTFLRKEDNVMTFRRRLFQRLHESAGTEAKVKRSDKDEHEKSQGSVGSALTWRLSFLSCQMQILEDVKRESENKDTIDENSDSVLWCKLKEIWPLAFRRGGGINRMLKSLYRDGKSGDDQDYINDFNCFGYNSDLPTVGMAIPLAAFEDLVRCRAGYAVGSAHCFKFDQRSGRNKLHKRTTVPANQEGSNDLESDAKQWKDSYNDGIVIRG